MSGKRRHLLLFATAGVWLALTVASHAEDEGDQDLARGLYQTGQILPLRDILTAARATGGDVVAINLGRADGRWVYRLQMLSVDGELSTLAVDAAAAIVIPDKGDGP